MSRKHADIDLAITKATAKRDKAKVAIEESKERYKKAEEALARLVMLRDNKKMENLQSAVSSKGLSFDALIAAVNSGNFEMLTAAAGSIKTETAAEEKIS